MTPPNILDLPSHDTGRYSVLRRTDVLSKPRRAFDGRIAASVRNVRTCPSGVWLERQESSSRSHAQGGWICDRA